MCTLSLVRVTVLLTVVSFGVAVDEHPLVQTAVRYARSVDASSSVCHRDSQLYESFVRRTARKQVLTSPDASSTRQLYEWCKADARCCKTYHMRSCDSPDADDFDAFRYLISHWHSHQQPLTVLLDVGSYCGQPTLLGDAANSGLDRRSDAANETLPDADDGSTDALFGMLRAAWLLELRLQAHENKLVHCADSEHFVYSADDSEGRCVCDQRNNDACHATRRHRRRSPWNYSLVAIVVAASAATLLFVVQAVTLFKQLSVYDKLVAADTSTQPAQPAAVVEKRGAFFSMLQQKKHT